MVNVHKPSDLKGPKKSEVDRVDVDGVGVCAYRACVYFSNCYSK